MHVATNSELHATARRQPTDTLSNDRDAVRWIARQLEWERTLDVLRTDEKVDRERKAA